MISLGWCSLKVNLNKGKFSENGQPKNANSDPFFEYKKSLDLGLANLHIIG